MSVRYLNVDCILRSDKSLSLLLSHLKEDIFVLWDESFESIFSVGFETNLLDSSSPEEDILEFLRLFDGLPADLRRLLNDCNERVLDIGFEGGSSGESMNVSIGTSVIARLSQYGFSIGIRIYPASDSEPDLPIIEQTREH